MKSAMRMQSILSTGLGLALLAASLGGCTSNEPGKSGLPPAQDSEAFDPVAKAQKEVENSSRRSPLAGGEQNLLERYVGAVTPIREATIGPKASGTISAILVEEGDTVKKGTTLFRLAGGAQSIGIKQAQASLSGAVIARDQAKRALDRQQKLKDRGSISSANYDQAKSAYDQAEAGVAQAKAAVSMARRNRADTAAIAPFDGLIVRRFKQVGETVTMMPPTPVILLQDQTTLELRVKLPEMLLRTLEVGREITAEFPALNISRTATIARIQPMVDPITRTVEIVAHLSNKDGLLKPGMYVEISSQAFAPPAPQNPDVLNNPDLNLKANTGDAALAAAEGAADEESES